MDVEPGHFDKSFMKNLEKTDLIYLIERLKTELTDEPYARRHSLMMLQGVACCLLEKNEDGMSMFKKVLKEDCTNLNALKNKQWVSDALGLKQKAKEVTERIRDIIENSSPEELNVIRARALIQIGRAACYTDQHHIHTDRDSVKTLFETALEMGKDNPNKDELIEWEFALGYHLFRMADMMRNINKDEEKYFKQGLHCLYGLIIYTDAEVKRRGLKLLEEGDKEENSQNREWRSNRRVLDVNGKAWAFSGALLNWHDTKYDTLSSVLPHCQPAHAHLSGLQCLEKAREIAPRCGFILVHVARQYYNVGYLEEAIKVATQAIRVLPIGLAFHVRGKIYLDLYQFNRKLNSATKNIVPDEISVLNQAIEDLEKAHEVNFKPSHALCNLGVAHRLKGDKRDLKKALSFFNAAETALGGTKDDRLFDEWAKTLDAVGEREGAEEKRARAVQIRKNNIIN